MTSPEEHEGLEELYREVIIDHYRHPRHSHDVFGADVSSVGYNPLCGDEVIIQIKMEDRKISDVGVRGKGCSISQASGSMLAEALIGRTFTEAKEYIAAVKGLLENSTETAPEGNGPPVALGDLEALSGVRNFPVRIKCALIPWTTLEEGIERYEERHGEQ